MNDLKLLTSQPTMENMPPIPKTLLSRLQPVSDEEAKRVKEALEEEIMEFQRNLRKHEKRGYTSLQEKDWQITFDTLKVIPENAKQVARLQTWHPEMQRGIVLWGSVGTGKSTLCKAIINRFASMQYRCLFISVADAMQRLKDAIDMEGMSVGDETEKLIRPDILFLDDLGAEKATEWATERIFVIFEKRAAQKKHTFFTTNLIPEEISRIYKERIKDRMIEFCTWIKFEGPSFRKLNYRDEI